MISTLSALAAAASFLSAVASGACSLKANSRYAESYADRSCLIASRAVAAASLGPAFLSGIVARRSNEM
jgi:hypothetical protein